MIYLCRIEFAFRFLCGRFFFLPRKDWYLDSCSFGCRKLLTPRFTCRRVSIVFRSLFLAQLETSPCIFTAGTMGLDSSGSGFVIAFYGVISRGVSFIYSFAPANFPILESGFIPPDVVGCIRRSKNRSKGAIGMLHFGL